MFSSVTVACCVDSFLIFDDTYVFNHLLVQWNVWRNLSILFAVAIPKLPLKLIIVQFASRKENCDIVVNQFYVIMITQKINSVQYARTPQKWTKWLAQYSWYLIIVNMKSVEYVLDQV